MSVERDDAPLGGLVVLDLSRALAGPQAAMMLGDMGARVIKIERPTGDDSRGWGPPFVGEGENIESTYFFCANRNKESITLDLKDERDRDVLCRLVERADVLIENFRTGVLDRLGFSTVQLHELNPALIILSITGFGHDGPDSSRPGYDQILQGEGGLMSVTGPTADEPTKVGVPIADLLAGMNGAYGVLTALYERERTGRGRVVRTSLLAAVVGAHAFQGTQWTVGREVPTTAGSHHPAIAPYGLFRTASAPIQVACGSESLWKAFATAVGLDPADPRFALNQQRVELRTELTGEIEALFEKRPAEHWLKVLATAGVPSGMVRSLDEVYKWDQTISQGLLIEVDHATQGILSLPGPTIRFDDNTHAGGQRTHLAPPTLGQHNASVKSWLEEPLMNGRRARPDSALRSSDTLCNW
ncbi:CoA transferase [Rhodococcus sp. ZPP]|uniref:CaiB/BaiF CoA transferase family protein n=1 Tax=Rhodococcus sp. ZPP TaxID=2749906 RepID=UPI001AD8770D|nr:CoA transferase [Rhodococcus sp. ZPP]QTJ69858.1 CoA transferase [Rhodococcus sp. ZPP]